ncbi:MAG: RNA polymerase factor sigma-54 [Anaerosomatales bacterium]|nr:RNA polymerase factor sigma-54 [Anaerosomatales bacterium]
MDVSQRLDLRHTVTMSPEAYQGLAILAMPAAELAQVVEAELVQNPVLEAEEPEGDTAEAEEPAEAPEAHDQAWEEWVAEYEELQRLDGAAEHDPDRTSDRFEERMPAAVSLEQHLLDQVVLWDVSESVARAARVVIGLLDDDGFFTGSLEEVERMARVDATTAREALALVKLLDPPGIGSRTLEEALEAQAEALGVASPLLTAIIRRHLDAAAAGRVRRIARAEGVSEDAVHEALEALRMLNPRPAAGYASGQTIGYVSPDVVVRRFDGEWVVLPDYDVVPMLRVSPRYRAMLKDGRSVDEDTRRYLKEHIKKAESFIRNVDRRRETVVRIAEVIVETQREFFETGSGPLKPLRLEDVAVELGIHLSTVSRGVTGKYMATPYGLFELRHFFSGGYRTRSGIDVAATSVKQRIKELVRDEESGSPLSDQRIAGLLAEEGVVVARRTVAKYREELGIPPSWMRRRRADASASQRGVRR